jgi:hypothetical protein
MAQKMRRAKGESGFQNTTYRSVDGQLLPAKITGATALATPVAPTVASVGAAGTTTYTYKYTAVNATGESIASAANAAFATGNAVLDGTNFNRLTLTAVTGAVQYNVYGRLAGDAYKFLGSTTTTTYDDKNIVAPTGATAPAAATGASFNVIIPSLRQGPSGGANSVKTNLAVGMLPKPGTNILLPWG